MLGRPSEATSLGQAFKNGFSIVDPMRRPTHRTRTHVNVHVQRTRSVFHSPDYLRHRPDRPTLRFCDACFLGELLSTHVQRDSVLTERCQLIEYGARAAATSTTCHTSGTTATTTCTRSTATSTACTGTARAGRTAR